MHDLVIPGVMFWGLGLILTVCGCPSPVFVFIPILFKFFWLIAILMYFLVLWEFWEYLVPWVCFYLPFLPRR